MIIWDNLHKRWPFRKLFCFMGRHDFETWEVYFAVPEHDAILPSGISVGAWLHERMSRLRIY